MELHGVDQIISAINAKSYSVVPQKPDIGYPPNGRFEEIFDLEDKKKLHPDAKVVSAIAKDHHSYQSNEELCYMMRVNSAWPSQGVFARACPLRPAEMFKEYVDDLSWLHVPKEDIFESLGALQLFTCRYSLHTYGVRPSET